MSIFKRTAKAVAEVIQMDAAGAQKAAEESRIALSEASRAVIAAETKLDDAYVVAAIRDIPAFEAALSDARLTAERAQRAYHAAEKRLATAKDREASAGKADWIAKRDAALQRRAQAALEMDRLAMQMAEQCRAYDVEANVLSEAARAGVASRDGYINGDSILRAALVKAGAVESQYSKHLADAPSGVDVAERAAGAVLAVA